MMRAPRGPSILACAIGLGLLAFSLGLFDSADHGLIAELDSAPQGVADRDPETTPAIRPRAFVNPGLATEPPAPGSLLPTAKIDDNASLTLRLLHANGLPARDYPYTHRTLTPYGFLPHEALTDEDGRVTIGFSRAQAKNGVSLDLPGFGSDRSWFSLDPTREFHEIRLPPCGEILLEGFSGDSVSIFQAPSPPAPPSEDRWATDASLLSDRRITPRQVRRGNDLLLCGVPLNTPLALMPRGDNDPLRALWKCEGLRSPGERLVIDATRTEPPLELRGKLIAPAGPGSKTENVSLILRMAPLEDARSCPPSLLTNTPFSLSLPRSIRSLEFRLLNSERFCVVELPQNVGDVIDLGELRLRRPPLLVSGQIVDEREVPVSFARVEIPALHAGVHSNEHGEFELRGRSLEVREPTVLRLRVTSGRKLASTSILPRELDVSPGDELRIRCKTGATLRYRIGFGEIRSEERGSYIPAWNHILRLVIDRFDRPIGSVSPLVIDQGAGWQGFFQGLPAGTARLEILHQGWPQPIHVIEGLKLVPGKECRDPRLDMPAPPELQQRMFTLVDEQGSPLHGVRATIALLGRSVEIPGTGPQARIAYPGDPCPLRIHCEGYAAVDVAADQVGGALRLHRH